MAPLLFPTGESSPLLLHIGWAWACQLSLFPHCSSKRISSPCRSVDPFPPIHLGRQLPPGGSLSFCGLFSLGVPHPFTPTSVLPLVRLSIPHSFPSSLLPTSFTMPPSVSFRSCMGGRGKALLSSQRPFSTRLLSSVFFSSCLLSFRVVFPPQGKSPCVRFRTDAEDRVVSNQRRRLSFFLFPLSFPCPCNDLEKRNGRRRRGRKGREKGGKTKELGKGGKLCSPPSA